MAHQLSASVGTAGQNRTIDVQVLQKMLADHGLYRGQLDGKCGPLTVGAILQFQRGFMTVPDGRVDLHGQTWRRLSTSHANVQQAQATQAAPASHPASAAKPAVKAAAAPAPAAAPAVAPATQPQILTAGQALTASVPRPDKNSINQGLVAVSPSFMVEQLGQPRDTYSANCQPLTNTTLKKHIVTQSVGRFSVTGLDAAVSSLRDALAQIQREQPAVYNALGTAGMLCCRYIRGSSSAISNHSWGTAIDFTINGVLDVRGDNKVQVGLTLIAPIMNQHGWYWGAAFRTEDGMHFEASRALISQWAPNIR